MRGARLFALGVLAMALVMPSRARAEDEAPESPPPPQEVPSARVIIRTTIPVTLLQRKAKTSEWNVACVSPCEKDLPLADDYRLTGGGIRPSDDFKLHAVAGEAVELRVRPSTMFTWELGVIIGGTGFLVDAVAVYLLVVSLAVKVGDCTGNGAFISVVAQGVCRGQPTPATLRAISFIALVPGTVAMIGGIATASSAWTTRLTQEPLVRPRSSAFLGLSEAPEHDVLGAPSFVSLPFASGRF